MTIEEIVAQLNQEFPTITFGLENGLPTLVATTATEEELIALHPQVEQRLQELEKLMSNEDSATIQFKILAAIGKELMELHTNYEQQPEYPLEWHWSEPKSWRVERMRFNKDKTIIIVNPSLFLSGIPSEAHQYILGNRSALEWVIDQYQVTEDKRSGIVSDPNREDDPEYIARLVCKVCYVSVETVRLQQLMTQITGPEDWVGVENIETMFEQTGKASTEMPDGSLWSE